MKSRTNEGAGRPSVRRLLQVALAAALAMSLPVAADDLDDLFDLDLPLDAADEVDAFAGSGLRIGGYGEFAAAYTVASPTHWSKLRGRFELGASGRIAEGVRLRVVGRADYDAAYDVESNYYPAAVRRNQRREASLREAYVDFDAGGWDFRLGRQHVVWGEMVGLFLADVVSARDLREFFLPEFETMRIPQWAARAEYFAGENHFELLWIPYPSYDEVGKPGADFYPFPVPEDVRVRNARPDRKLSNTNWGLRVSRLVSGWDLSAFYYQSRDVAPTLYSTASGLELRNDRIRQVGGTFSKDLGAFVLKGEAVHSDARRFLVEDAGAPFGIGLHKSRTLDYVIGADMPFRDWRFDFQVYGRRALDHDRSLGFDRDEVGWTALVNRKFGDQWEAELLYVASFNRSDYMLRPKLVWNITQEWRGQFGADLFGGRKEGLFGQYKDRDRVYVELRRWF